MVRESRFSGEHHGNFVKIAFIKSVRCQGQPLGVQAVSPFYLGLPGGYQGNTHRRH